MDVKKIHTRPIYFNDGKSQFYFTTTNDGVRKQGKTIEALWKNLEEYYKTHDGNNFEHVFELAIADKGAYSSQKTIDRYHQEYNLFVTPALAKKNIKDIDTKYYMDYVEARLKAEPMNKKKYFKLIGIFNLVFDYALDNNLIQFEPRRRNHMNRFKAYITDYAPQPTN